MKCLYSISRIVVVLLGANIPACMLATRRDNRVCEYNEYTLETGANEGLSFLNWLSGELHLQGRPIYVTVLKAICEAVLFYKLCIVGTFLLIIEYIYSYRLLTARSVYFGIFIFIPFLIDNFFAYYCYTQCFRRKRQ